MAHTVRIANVLGAVPLVPTSAFDTLGRRVVPHLIFFQSSLRSLSGRVVSVTGNRRCTFGTMTSRYASIGLTRWKGVKLGTGKLYSLLWVFYFLNSDPR